MKVRPFCLLVRFSGKEPQQRRPTVKSQLPVRTKKARTQVRACGKSAIYRISASLFHFLARVTPTGDAGGQMLHVLVAQLLGCLRGGLVGGAFGAATIGNDQRLFVLR